MKNRLLFLASISIAIIILASLVACQQSQQTTATPTPAKASGAAVKDAAEKPAAAVVPASAAVPAAASTPAASLPVAVLEIVPVAANNADPHVIKAILPGTTTTVAMGATGLPNVSVGVPVTLRGSAVDPKAPAKTYAWTLTKPNASKASLDKNDAEVAKFTPDVPGVYKVDVIVGNDAGKSPMASVQIRAGTYVGVEQGNCGKCHEDKFNEWSKTPHSTKFSREINGAANPSQSKYNEGCVRCHATGYYIGVSNGGFADIQAKLGWKFPSADSIKAGQDNWSQVPNELKQMANIQCEVCHGPASNHIENVSPMGVSLDEGVCNVCHNGGGTHVKGEMFKNSKHSLTEDRPWTYPTGPARQDCVRCHSGYGFISFLENPTEKATWDNRPHTTTCAVCHDPHSEENTYQLRIVGKPVEVLGITKDFGLSAVCVECHNARTKPEDAQKGSFPHYSAAAEMLSDTGGVDYGRQVPNSLHSKVGIAPVGKLEIESTTKLFGGNVPGPCVVCHMWPTPADAKDPNRFKVGDHSFNVNSPDGKFHYTDSCQECHPGIKEFNLPSHNDLDGNGKTEGVQDELAGLLKVLENAIGESGVKPVEGHPYFDRDDLAKANEKQKNAIYNYLFVRGPEGSDGKAAAVHNFKRSVALLQLSYKDLTGKDVPNATLMSK